MKIGRVLTGVVFAAAVLSANAEERFFVGCNYWASHAGMMMWRDWDGARVEGDLDRCRAEGMTMLRVFPLWPDFQPLTAEYGGGGAFRGWTQAGGSLRDELRAAAEEAGLAPVVQKPETAPELVLSEHPDGKGGTYVVAVNASPKPLVCKLKIDGKVECVWGGKLRDGELTLPPNDGCVFRVCPALSCASVGSEIM